MALRWNISAVIGPVRHRPKFAYAGQGVKLRFLTSYIQPALRFCSAGRHKRHPNTAPAGIATSATMAPLMLFIGTEQLSHSEVWNQGTDNSEE